MDSKARARLEKMMEYGEGIKPSARSIRVTKSNDKSNNNNPNNDVSDGHEETNQTYCSSTTTDETATQKEPNLSNATTTTTTTTTTIVKDFIVERYNYNTPTIRNIPRHDTSQTITINDDITSHTSQFAIQAAGCRPKDSPTKSKWNNRGFPSYYNYFPVGSLARRREPLKLPLSVKANSNKTKAFTCAISSVSTPASTPTTTSKNHSSSSADAIISNMSKVQIQEYIAQIHSSLSEDKVAFLRQRGKENKTHTLLYNLSNGIKTSNVSLSESTDSNLQEQSTHSALQQQKSTEQQQQQQGTIVKNTTTEISSTTVNNPNRKDIEFYRELSSIQSPQDLDQLFQKYQSATIEEYKLKQILQNYGITTSLGNINNNITRNTNDFYYFTRIHNEDKRYAEGGQEQEIEERFTQDEQELEYATSLLRSSSQKQRFIGSKIICDMLRDQVEKSANDDRMVHKWPIHLPVSLRCLLDDNSSSSRKGKYQSIMMNAHVLESIYSLLLLFSPPEVTNASKSLLNSLPQNGGLIYPLYVMKDSIPTLGKNSYPPLTLSAPLKPSVNLNEDSTTSSEPVMIYTTNNNFSARSDGLSFYNDPLWTLLSRMQIIPCIGNLVKLYIDSRDATAIDEGLYRYYSRLSLVFLCHILLMLSLRTPGAASAIVDNKNILPLLIKIALPLTAPSTTSILTNTTQSATEETVDSLTLLFDPQIAVPFLTLIITLARQSRHVASSLSKSYINHLQATLAVSAETDLEWLVQKLCLVVWRIFLRYGLAISYTSILVNLGAFMVKWRNASEQSLLPEYLATYAELCHCTLVVTKNSSASSLIINLHREEQETIDEKIGIWIAPTIEHIVAVLSTDYLWRGENVFLVSTPQHLSSTAEIFKTTASMLNLLSAYQNTTRFLHKISHRDTNLNSGFHLVLSEESALSILQSVLNSGAIEKAVRTVLTNTFDSTVGCDADDIVDWLKLEASSCALIVAFLSLMDDLHNMIIIDKYQQSDEAMRKYENFFLQVKDVLVDGCRLIGGHPQKVMLTAVQQLLFYNRFQRESWLNYATFSIIMFLCNLCYADSEVTKGFTTEKDSIVQLLRPLTFCLLGRLRHGDEYVALKLLQQNTLFQPAICEGKEAQSQLPKMLMQQLFDNAESCDQLAHSTNVNLPNDFPGRFLLASLRSDADQSVMRKVIHDQHEADEETMDDTSPLLPLGPLWLFHVLSSTCVVNHQNRTMTSSRCVEESSSILRSTLELLLHMEQQSISNSCEKWSLYTGVIHSGEKLYHLFNICFFPDGVLDSDVQDLFLRLFTIYNTVDENGCDLVRAFMRACFNHLQRNQRRHSNINPWVQKHSNNEQNKSLMDFATDLCTAFDAYGAQYDVFVMCIRFLMRPEFPSDIITHVILQVKDNWHLLTTTSEEEEEDCSNYQHRVMCYVEDGLRGGIPSLDGSSPDPSQILLAYCSVLKCYRGRMLLTAQHPKVYFRGVFYVVAVATIARNFALTGELSSAAVQKRYGELSQETAMHIWEVATKCLRGNGTKHDLSQIALDVCCRFSG